MSTSERVERDEEEGRFSRSRTDGEYSARGKATYKGKRSAVKRQRDEAVEQHTAVEISMKTISHLITEKAKRDKRLKFTSLVHHINEANLAQCYGELKRDKASGIDGVTVLL